jgi:hypothetical protein
LLDARARNHLLHYHGTVSRREPFSNLDDR